MTGEVTPTLSAVVRLRITGPVNAAVGVNAAIDTGFSGYLTLPENLITLLGLPYVEDREAQMGDGRIVTMRLFRATVAWEGGDRTITVHQANVNPLVGTALLRRNHLGIDFIDGGRVSIESLG